MRYRIIFILMAALGVICGAAVVVGCGGNAGGEKPAPFGWAGSDSITYCIDYEICFASDHDSAMQLSVHTNHGHVAVIRRESENLFDADGNRVWNTFIVLEDSLPDGKCITLSRGSLSYTGGKPEYLHVQTVGSDDLAELRVAGSDKYTFYSIRDNLFYGPDEQQSFTIPGGRKFSVVLPVMTEERFPRQNEIHHIQIAFSIATDSMK